MFEKIYSKLIWVILVCILVYFITDNTLFGLAGGVIFFALAIAKVTYDAMHHQLPWQQQQANLEAEGLGKKKLKAVPKRKNDIEK